MMKKSQFKDQSISELRELLSSKLRDQFKLRLVKASGELTQTHKLREMRRTIASLLTNIAEKEGKSDD